MEKVRFEGKPVYGDPFTTDHLMYYQYLVQETFAKDHSGDFYTAADYEALEAKLAALEKRLWAHQT